MLRNGTSISISTDGAGLGSLQNNQAKSIDAQLGAYNFSQSPNEISGKLVDLQFWLKQKI